VLSHLPRKERNALSGRLLIGQWYPFDAYVAMLRAIDDTFGKGDNRLIVELGKFSAENGLSSIYKVFLKAGSPNFIISRASSIWSSYYEPGEMKVKKNDPGHAVVQLIGWPKPKKEHCERVRGWIIRAIEMSGGKGVTVLETKCQCKGADHCEYELRWS